MAAARGAARRSSWDQGVWEGSDKHLIGTLWPQVFPRICLSCQNISGLRRLSASAGEAPNSTMEGAVLFSLSPKLHTHIKTSQAKQWMAGTLSLIVALFI